MTFVSQKRKRREKPERIVAEEAFKRTVCAKPFSGDEYCEEMLDTLYSEVHRFSSMGMFETEELHLPPCEEYQKSYVISEMTQKGYDFCYCDEYSFGGFRISWQNPSENPFCEDMEQRRQKLCEE